MLRNKKLHDFLHERSEELTEDWYEKLEKSPDGMDGTAATKWPEKLKRYNYEFSLLYYSMITKEIDEFREEFQEWMLRTAKDEDFLSAPLTEVLSEFFQMQKEYLQLIAEFASIHREETSREQLATWNQGVTSTVNDLILEFTAQHTQAAKQRMDAQQTLIDEMSAPIIFLTQDIGVLALAGEIAADRAQAIGEKALKQSYDANLEKLFIDLSRVPMIDTRGAQQIFQLMDGLRIIGVKVALAGISPVMAKLFIQSNFDFSEIEISNTLTQAMKLENRNPMRTIKE